MGIVSFFIGISTTLRYALFVFAYYLMIKSIISLHTILISSDTGETMENRASIPLLSMIFLGLFFLSTHKVFAWGPIAHYVITKEALGNEGVTMAPYANLPDAWPSQTGLLGWLDTGIYFRWSHGVIDHGHYNLYIGTAWVPKKPTYPDDGRYPGQVMKELLDNKLDNSGGKWGDSAILRLVQKGFRAHNAADRIVHWDFFLGAHDALTNSEKIEAWTVHHGLKETWAEYMILEQQYPSNTISFQDNGSIAPPNSCQSLGIPNLNGNVTYMAKLLRTAQGVYRKNRTRHRVSVGDEDYYSFTPQATSEIATLIQNFNTDLQRHFNKSHWAIWEAANINFVSDYVISKPDGSTRPVTFETPNTLEDEYELLKQVQEKYDNELELIERRNKLGFVWKLKKVIEHKNSSKTKVSEWMNQ